MDRLKKMLKALSNKYQDSWQLYDKYVDVKLPRRNRHQRVIFRRKEAFYYFESVVMGRAKVNQFDGGKRTLSLMAWQRNADHEIVNFAFDIRDRLVGVVRHPAEHLDSEELELYIAALTHECDRFEFLISGRDRF